MPESLIGGTPEVLSGSLTTESVTATNIGHTTAVVGLSALALLGVYVGAKMVVTGKGPLTKY